MAKIGLVSCVSKKLSHPAKAADLYVSSLFTKARALLERECDSWFILSAKHGLLSPHEMVEPYNETLKNKSGKERVAWAEKVWHSLVDKIKPGDEITILAGKAYRENLMPRLKELGCRIKIPLEGLPIGKQLKELKIQLAQRSPRERDLVRFYKALHELEQGVGGKRILAQCTARSKWPSKGVYFFFEPGELCNGNGRPRVVRVGTHGVSRSSKSTLWARLRNHRGSTSGGGNHRGSIFRLHVGAALSARDPLLAVATWSVGQSAKKEIRNREVDLERKVSLHIGSMSVLWLAVEDDAGRDSDRSYLERNAIGLLCGKDGAADAPSPNWLGYFSPNPKICESGLWNLDHLDFEYSSDFLDVLEEYVLVTIGEKPKPVGSIAPKDWHKK